MKRRTAFMTLAALFLSRQNVFTQQRPGHLTVDLGQWVTLTVKHKGKEVTLPMSEVFDTLEELPQ